MGLSKLIEAGVVIVMIAAAAGQLPRLTRAVRMAQLEVLRDSRASNWGHAMLLPIAK